jgi:uncharacterized protein involved in outer membrane biogenesis
MFLFTPRNVDSKMDAHEQKEDERSVPDDNNDGRYPQVFLSHYSKVSDATIHTSGAKMLMTQYHSINVFIPAPSQAPSLVLSLV